MRFGILAATVANCSMNRDPHRPPMQPHDFFRSLGPPPERQMTDEQIQATLEHIYLLHKRVN